MIENRALYERTWELLQKILTDFGTTMGSLMAFEYTYVHWFHQLEDIPISVALEAALQPLYEVELKSYLADLPEGSEEERHAHKEILVDSLTNIKNFVSSWGVTIQDFFTIDRKRLDPDVKGKGKSKDQPKGASLEQFPVLGGKSKGKSGSTKKPKEPTPLTKQGDRALQLRPVNLLLQWW